MYTSKRDVLTEFTLAGSISGTKEEIIRAHILLCSPISGRRRGSRKAEDIAAALQISEIDLDAIIEGSEPIDRRGNSG